MFAAIKAWVIGNTDARDEAFAVLTADQWNDRVPDELAVLTNLFRPTPEPRLIRPVAVAFEQAELPLYIPPTWAQYKACATPAERAALLAGAIKAAEASYYRHQHITR